MTSPARDSRQSELLIGRPADAALEIGNPDVSLGYPRVPIRLVAPSIDAAAFMEFEPWSGGIARLTAYFVDLAAHWSGWEGAKDLMDDSGTVAISATHDGKGMVVLKTSVRNYAHEGAGVWLATAFVPVEPGALSRIADEVARLASSDIRRR